MSINLMYHDVTAAGQEQTSGFPGSAAARYKITPEEFERHLEQISFAVKQQPFCSTSSDDLIASDPNKWSITFDDGGLSACTEIAERLERRGWRGWFFIPTDLIGTPAFCSREQIQDLHRRGHVIGSHSCSHPVRISRCSWDQIVDEWTRSCGVLADIIGQPVTTASVPGGFYSREVARAAAQAGIRVLFNSEPTTSLSQVESTWIVGRYNVYRGMSATDAASLVSSPFRRFRQAAFWNLKKVAKFAVGPLYKTIRQRILSSQYDEDRATGKSQ